MPTSIFIVGGVILIVLLLIRIANRSSQQEAQIREERLKLAQPIGKNMTAESLDYILGSQRWQDCTIQKNSGRWRVIEIVIPQGRNAHWPAFIHVIARQDLPMGPNDYPAEAIRATADLVLETVYGSVTR